MCSLPREKPSRRVHWSWPHTCSARCTKRCWWRQATTLPQLHVQVQQVSVPLLCLASQVVPRASVLLDQQTPTRPRSFDCRLGQNALFLNVLSAADGCAPGGQEPTAVLAAGHSHDQRNRDLSSASVPQREPTALSVGWLRCQTRLFRWSLWLSTCPKTPQSMLCSLHGMRRVGELGYSCAGALVRDVCYASHPFVVRPVLESGTGKAIAC